MFINLLLGYDDKRFLLRTFLKFNRILAFSLRIC